MISLVFALSAAGGAYAGLQDWSHYGHFANRNSIAVEGPNTIDANTLKWIASEDPQDPLFYVEFEGATAPVVYNGKVYAYAKYYNELGENTNSQIIAYDANSGEIKWAAPIDQAIFDSQSSPCVDEKHNTVLIGSGDKLFALDAQTGTQKWSTQLEKAVVNASVCAAVDIPYARAFITDYDGFGPTGRFYCINLEPYSGDVHNPYQAGDIVWSDTIGASCGNSPAYKKGVVYAASISKPNSSEPNTGTIRAYDATANTAVKLWETTDSNFEGFSGGLTVTKEGFVYAVNYDWREACEDNSAMCKIDCNDGSIVWITKVERTNAMPVVVGDKIYISGGIGDDPPWFVGSRPKVEAYQDLGESVIKLWETPADMIVGGWTNQPVYANGKLYVGAIPIGGNYFGAYTDLYILDVTAEPNDPNFVIDHYPGCGNSPAVTYDSIYTIGYDGLFKFHQHRLPADFEGNGGVDIHDLSAFVDTWLYDGPVGVKRCDLDLDGDVDFMDFVLLANDWCKELN